MNSPVAHASRPQSPAADLLNPDPIPAAKPLQTDGSRQRTQARRSHRQRAMPVPLDERRWLTSLDSPELERHVRELNAVDRAAAAGRRAREREAA